MESKKVRDSVLQQPVCEMKDTHQVRELSKEDLKEVAGGCGDMGGVVVIRF